MKRYILLPLAIAMCLSLDMQAGIKDNIKHNWTKHKTAIITFGTLSAASLAFTAYVWSKAGHPFSNPKNLDEFERYTVHLFSMSPALVTTMGFLGSLFSKCRCEKPKTKMRTIPAKPGPMGTFFPEQVVYEAENSDDVENSTNTPEENNQKND